MPEPFTIAALLALKAIIGGHAAAATTGGAAAAGAHYGGAQYAVSHVAASHYAASQTAASASAGASQAGVNTVNFLLSPTAEALVVGLTLTHLSLQIAQLLGRGVDHGIFTHQQARRGMEQTQHLTEEQKAAMKKDLEMVFRKQGIAI